MSLTVWLDLIRQEFSPEDGQTLVKSLPQDPLVWQFLQDEKISLPFFTNAPSDLCSYAPGKMAAWLIEQKTGSSFADFSQNEITLPTELKTAAAQALKTVFHTGLPPADLYTAGLIALTLHERRLRKGIWKGLSEEIFILRNPESIIKNYRIWQTPFACLFSYCQDFNDLTDEFFSSSSESIRKAFIPILLHTLISNPMRPEQLIGQLFEFIKPLPIDSQLESLHWLGDFNQEQLQNKLAKQLLQTKGNQSFFARVFSAIESFEAVSPDVDPLEKPIAYTLPEDINRLAAFYHFAGNIRKAAETYQKASDLLEFLKSQSLFQTLVADTGYTAPTRWLEIIKSVPHSKQARLFYARSLIANEQFEEARQQLQELPDTLQKQLLLNQMPNEGEKLFHALIQSHIPASKWSHKKGQAPSSYYVNPPRISPEAEVLFAIQQTEHQEDILHWLEKYLHSNLTDLRVVKIARDLYEKANQIEKTIELTAYLERIEPTNNAHKRALARLYTQSERWQDAYEFLQTLVKSDGNNEVEELEMFAEAAVRTKQLETATSICQNILSRSENNPKALVLLGEIYHLKGDALKAMQHMESVVDLIPSEAEAWLTLAWLWAENDQTDRALETLKKGIKIIPDHPRLLRALGKAEADNQSYSEALSAYKQAYELDPHHIKGKVELAEVFLNVGQPEHAYPLLEGFGGNYEQNPTAARLLGHTLLALDQFASAEPILLFSAQQFPEDIETVVAALQLSLDRVEADPESEKEDMLGKISAVLTHASQIHPEQVVLDRLLADVERLSGQNQSAFNTYSRLAKAADQQNLSKDWRLKYGLGQAAIGLGKHEIGLAALQDALNIQPSNLIVQHALADALMAAELPGKANAIAKSALIMAPQDFNNILWYANFKTRSNDPDEAVRALKEALQFMPQRGELRLWLAKTLITSGALEEAQENIAEFITSSPQNPDLLHQAAYICVHLNDLEKAALALEKALQISPQFNPILVMDQAVIQSLMGQHKNALDVLDVEQRLINQYPQIALLKADLLSNLGQYEQACTTLLSIDEHRPQDLNEDAHTFSLINNSPLLYSHDLSLEGYDLRLGYLYRALGHLAEAQKHFSLALEETQHSIKLKNALIENAMVGLDHEPALAMIDLIDPSGRLETIDSHDWLDLVCSQIEILIYQDDYKQAVERFMPLIDSSYPRCLALQSRFAANSGNFNLAAEQLNESIKSFNSTIGNYRAQSLPLIYRQMINLHSIAEASLALDNHLEAIQGWSKVYDQLETQPLFNWRYLYALATAAEAQQTAQTVSVTAHAPGAICLSEEHYKTAEGLLDSIQNKLPHDQVVCLKARIESAFTGTWPTHLNVDACMQGPEEAAAVLIGSQDEALVQDILEAYPDNIDVLQAYGVYTLKNNRSNAIPQVEKALSIDPANPINHALLAYLMLEQPDRALKSIEAALNIWPDEAEWHALAADLYARTSNPEMAEKHIQHALHYQPENASYWQQSATLNVNINNYAQARSDLEKSTTYQPGDAKAWAAMAEVNQRMGDVSDAITNIRKASHLAPGDQHLVNLEMKLLMEQKDFLAVEAKATAALENDKENESALVFLAKALAKQGQFEQALAALNRALENHPDNTNIALEYYNIKKEQFGVEKALPDLIALAKNNPADPLVLVTLADWLIQANRLDEAEKVAQSTLRLTPDQPEVHLMLGRLQHAQGKLDQAISHLSQAIIIDNTLVEAYLELGKTYQERRDLDKAIETFERGSQVNKSDPRPYYYAGLALKDIKDYPGAEFMLKAAKKYSPDDPNIIRQLGVVTALNLVNHLREAK